MTIYRGQNNILEMECKMHCPDCWIWTGKGHGGYMFRCRYCKRVEVADPDYIKIVPFVEIVDINACNNCIVESVMVD